MNGNTTVTEPILDSSSGKMSVIIAAPIWDTSTVQTHMISQVTQGIEQISDVIQTNSATAEESAAASKELSNQALILKKMVGGFKLRKKSTIFDITPLEFTRFCFFSCVYSKGIISFFTVVFVFTEILSYKMITLNRRTSPKNNRRNNFVDRRFERCRFQLFFLVNLRHKQLHCLICHCIYLLTDRAYGDNCFS